LTLKRVRRIFLPIMDNKSETATTSGRAAHYSDRINDAAFAAYLRKSNRWSLLFALGLFIITVIAFPIYGNISGDIDWPASLFYGVGIGGMFPLIAIGQVLRRRFDRTWDGVVVKHETSTRRVRSKGGRARVYTEYLLQVKKDNGGAKTHRWRNIPVVFSYYALGDHVRHHKGFSYYEKFDKSGDARILCIACNFFAQAEADICPRCKCPLLK
jgi:hypothetical protein